MHRPTRDASPVMPGRLKELEKCESILERGKKSFSKAIEEEGKQDCQSEEEGRANTGKTKGIKHEGRGGGALALKASA